MSKHPLFSKPVFGWAMYDFANSAYATSIMSVIFNVYLAKVLVPKEGLKFLSWMIPGPSVWGYLIALVMLVVLVVSPFLGALADRRQLKKPLFVLWVWIGAAATMGLVWAKPGFLWPTLGLSFLATLSFEMSLVFYNAFITDLGSDTTKGAISGWGFALGYIGGGLCLGLNLLMINRPEWFGLKSDPTWPMRAGFLVVGCWWLVFSLPAFIWLREVGEGSSLPFPLHAGERGDLTPPVVQDSFRQLAGTFHWVMQFKNLRRFLIAYVIYDDGIQTVILMASIFGAVALAMTAAELGLCFLLIQFVAFAGASMLGPLADKWGHKKVVLLTLVIYALVVVWAVVMKTKAEFWALGVIVGFILGGSQAASRSLFANMIPPDKSAELFAIYSVFGKMAAVAGPFTFAIVNQHWGLRPAVGSLLIFFLAGGLLLARVEEKQGQAN